MKKINEGKEKIYMNNEFNEEVDEWEEWNMD